MNEMINNFTEAAVEQGLKTIEMPSEAKKVVKSGLDGKSVAIGGVGGAILTATGMAVVNHIKNKPKAITDEIRNDPRVKEATIQKLLKKRDQAEKGLDDIYRKLDELGYEEVIVEEETPEA